MSNTPDDPNPHHQDIQEVKHQQLSARVPEHVGSGVFSTGALVICGNNEFVMDFVLRMMQPHQVVARVIVPHRVMGQVIQALGNNLEKYRHRFGEPPSLNPQPQEAPPRNPPGAAGDSPAPEPPLETESPDPPAAEAGGDPSGGGDPPVAAGGGGGTGATPLHEPDDPESPGESGEASPDPEPEPAPAANENPDAAPRPRIEDVYDELKLPDRMLAGSYANAVMISHSAAEFNFDFLANFYPRSAVSARVLMSAPHVPPLYDSLSNTWRHFQQRVAEQQRRQRRRNDDDGLYPG